MQYSIEIRDIHKIEKKNSYSFFVYIAQLLFVVMKTRKDIQCVKKKTTENKKKKKKKKKMLSKDKLIYY